MPTAERTVRQTRSSDGVLRTDVQPDAARTSRDGDRSRGNPGCGEGRVLRSREEPGACPMLARAPAGTAPRRHGPRELGPQPARPAGAESLCVTERLTVRACPVGVGTESA